MCVTALLICVHNCIPIEHNKHRKTFFRHDDKPVRRGTKRYTKDNKHTNYYLVYSFIFKQRLEGWPVLMSAYRKKLCLIFLPPRQSLWTILDTGLFDQTPTTLRSFLTSLTSNVWHSRLAADQLSTPRRGPTGPGQMPLHVGPDHMNVGPDWGPQRATPPTYSASHQSLKINSRKDIRGHQEQGGVSAAQVWRK